MQPVAPGLFELDDDGSITLIGGFSHVSGHHHFPLGPVCPFTRGRRRGAGAPSPGTGSCGRGPRSPTRRRATTARCPSASAWSSWTAIGLQVVTRLTETDPARLHDGQRMTLVTDRPSATASPPGPSPRWPE